MDLFLDLEGRGEPLRVRLERALREAVRSGRLAAGAALPPSRALAAELGVSRGVVVDAYEQLAAEGYLVTRRGSGTRVAPGAGEAAARAAQRGGAGEVAAQPGGAGEVAAQRGGAGPTAGSAEPPHARAAGSPRAERPLRYDLRPGLPELAAFPRRRWLAALAESVRELPDARLGYGDPRGAVELRVALAAYLGRVRGVIAEPDQVLVTGGLRQGLSLLWGALARSGLERVGVEDPGWPGQRDAVGAAGLAAAPIPVDRDGIVVEALEVARADAVVVTPANQFPSGAVLAPRRRAALVDWAARTGGLIVEDDYDAQYRYDRDPVGSLQGLAPELTVHGGSVSKLLAPALGIGWLVLPARLVEPVVGHAARAGASGSELEQLAFARLFESGEVDRHLRRARRLYRGRRKRVLEALRHELPEATIEGAAAGLHVVLRLPDGVNEAEVLKAARERGVRVFGMGAREPAILLGYGRLAEESAPRAVGLLAAAVRAQGARPD